MLLEATGPAPGCQTLIPVLFLRERGGTAARARGVYASSRSKPLQTALVSNSLRIVGWSGLKARSERA